MGDKFEYNSNNYKLNYPCCKIRLLEVKFEPTNQISIKVPKVLSHNVFNTLGTLTNSYFLLIIYVKDKKN